MTSPTLFSTAATLFSHLSKNKSRLAAEIYSPSQQVESNSTKITMVGKMLYAKDLDYATIWAVRSNDHYIFGHAEMSVFGKDKAVAKIRTNLKEFAQQFKSPSYSVIFASRFYNDKLSAIDALAQRNRELCYQHVVKACQDFGLEISEIKKDFVGTSIVYSDGYDINDLSKFRMLFTSSEVNQSRQENKQ